MANLAILPLVREEVKPTGEPKARTPLPTPSSIRDLSQSNHALHAEKSPKEVDDEEHANIARASIEVPRRNNEAERSTEPRASMTVDTQDISSIDSNPSSPKRDDPASQLSTQPDRMPSGEMTPDPLLDSGERINSRQDFLQAISAGQPGGTTHELARRVSGRTQEEETRSRPSLNQISGVAETNVSADAYQAVPSELGSLWTELVFVIVCSFGQLLFSFLLGSVTVTQTVIVRTLRISNSQAPWLVGAFLLANGLSVVISGSLADLARPRLLMVGAFTWLTIWNIIGSFSFTPSRTILFFVTRGMQGLAVGVLVSASMSILGRIYKPGTRKTQVFSGMAAAAPFGFWLGCIQGGLLSEHLPWIFGSNAMLCGICSVAAYLTIPPLRPAKDSETAAAPSMRNFDFIGATLAVTGCGCLLFGLTQGASANWAPYTYALAIVGAVLLVVFYFTEGYVARPLVPKTLWSTPGFTPLVISYFLSFGSYVGAWQYYAVQFFLNIKHATPLKTALYLTPNVICGVLAAYLVSRTLHLFAGHVILTLSMLAYAMGPVFFLPQTPSTSYWALSMPGIALVTFGPDLSFAAASIFVTSQVPRSYQGSAGSLLVTVQNLSAAVITAVGGTIGVKVQTVGETEEIGLEGLRAVWWFGFGLAVAAAGITAGCVRIPKSVEKAHAM